MDVVVAQQCVAEACHAQVVGIRGDAGVGARAVTADREIVASLLADDGRARVGLSTAVVRHGGVGAGHGQGARRHAHAGAGGAQVVVVAAQAGVTACAGTHGQTRHTAQQLVCLYMLAAEVAHIA